MSLHAIATGRDESMFLPDITANAEKVRAAVRGRRVLAVGAAGSIGSHTATVIGRFEPAALHVVDQNENALAELVRQFRSDADAPRIDDFRTLPLDYGAAATRYLMQGERRYDIVLNFAAIKHVRSEKDSFSILQMLDTNIIKQARFRRWLAETSPEARYFSVSTDKAANPSSFMGATKRIMEHILFDPAIAPSFRGEVTSARFANVAFSNGSLLQSFENRLTRREPLACPREIRRYFVSLVESGHICTLSALLAPASHIAIPRLDPCEHLVPLQGIAEAFLRAGGYTPKHYNSEDEAKAGLVGDIAAGHWPLIMTPADTGGEKPYEEFVTKGEEAVEIGLASMQAVRHIPPPNGNLADVVARLERVVAGNGDGVVACDIDKNRLKDMIGEIEPSFLETHRDSDRNLDQRA